MLTCEYFKHEIDELLAQDELNIQDLKTLKNLLVVKHFIAKDMINESEMPYDIAMHWANSLRNTDGTIGPHWSMDATSAIQNKIGCDCPRYIFWAVMNSLYSDYSKTLAKVNATPEIYGELARDWIHDADAVKAKAAIYYRCVVNHE